MIAAQIITKCASASTTQVKCKICLIWVMSPAMSSCYKDFHLKTIQLETQVKL